MGERNLYQQDRQSIFETTTAHGWDDIAEFLAERLRPTILLTFEEAPKIPVGVSKFGVVPDLPRYIDWPLDDERKPIQFIAQFSLKEVAEFDVANELPKRGMLFFFAHPEYWGEPEDYQRFCVIYSTDKPSACSPPKTRGGKNKVEVLPERRVRFEVHASMPRYDSAEVKARWPDMFADDRYVRLEFGVLEHLHKVDIGHRLLGYAVSIQADVCGECGFSASGIRHTEENSQDPDVLKLSRNEDGWRILFQVDSNKELGTMWGDAGVLYFCIRDKHLRKRQFERTWLVMQSG